MKLQKVLLTSALATAMLIPDFAEAVPVSAPAARQAIIDVQVSPGVELAASKYVKPGCRSIHCKPGYGHHKHRKHRHHKYYGRLIAGVVIGAAIVTAAGVAPRRPSHDLCWNWSNLSRTRGYWDYCY